MEEKILYIKHVVCPICIKTVRKILDDLGFDVSDVKLGQARIRVPADWDRDHLAAVLKESGFELLMNREQQLINQIKSTIIDLIHNQDYQPLLTNSHYLEEKLGISYSALAKVFSKHEEVTIEKYFICQKIERVKELLSYGELSLKEIGEKLGYSSLQHISHQFKAVTGMSASEYKKSQDKERIPLTEVGHGNNHACE